MALNVVLVNPEIPHNTGNIGRLCAVTNTVLHLIEPLGFCLTSKHLNRAGLDYWEHLEYYRYKNLDTFFEEHQGINFTILSSKVDKAYWDYKFKDGDFLFFGSETKGMPKEFMEKNIDKCLTIPQYNDNVRCLNLSNATSIVLYEAVRQIKIN